MTCLLELQTAGRGFRPARRPRHAFTLVELLVAMTVLLVLVLMMVTMVNQASRIWRGSRERITAFQSARGAFSRITANLSQATLNTYLDYYDGSGVTAKSRTDHARTEDAAKLALFAPKTYDRAADLHFICGQSDRENSGNARALIKSTKPNASRPTHCLFFQSPLGHVSDESAFTTSAISNFKNLSSTLNAAGYYVEFSDENDVNSGAVPKFMGSLPASWRYRLMELNEPSQNLSVYMLASGLGIYSGPDSWFNKPLNVAASPNVSSPTYPIAENIVALIIRPKVSNPSRDPQAPAPSEIAANYAYDTKAYLAAQPPVDVTGLGVRLSKNQLPPLVQVTLVAIDSPSGLRLANRYGATAPPLVDQDLFFDVTKYDSDLGKMEASLEAQHLNYRVFVADVSLPGAKWSAAQ